MTGHPVRSFWITVALLGVAGIAFILWHEKNSNMVDSAAPPFQLPSVGGGTRSLESFNGKVVILDFWATWCPPCRREIPDFIDLQKTYGGKGLAVVGIALDEEAKVRTFVQQNGINYDVLIGDRNVASDYGGIKSIPTTFVIDRSGTVVAKFVGLTTRQKFEETLQPLL